MPDKFDTIIAPKILGVEGGYTFNPDDPGGETIWGITVGTARHSGFTRPMKTMTKNEALAIYRYTYWQTPQFDKVAQLSFAVGSELFDTGVNMGTIIAGTFLQVALNAFNNQGSYWPDLSPDGRVGPATLRALQSYLTQRGAEGVQVLLRALEAQQGERYLSLAGSRPKDEEFEYGWFANRLQGRYDAA